MDHPMIRRRYQQARPRPPAWLQASLELVVFVGLIGALAALMIVLDAAMNTPAP